MSLKEKIAPLAAAGTFLVAGLGDKQPAGAFAQPRIAGYEQTQLAPDQRPKDPATQAYLESLNDYRRRILLKHQANILMSACVAWSNISGGITVTLNPGVAEVEYGGQKVNYYVFSTYDKDRKPSLFQMDGPPISWLGAITLVFEPEVPIKGGPDRKITSRVYQDSRGQHFYKDKQTGQPVINTKLTEGPLTNQRVAEVCDSLRHPKSGKVA